jgi:hypothetical protein
MLEYFETLKIKKNKGGTSKKKRDDRKVKGKAGN